MQLSFSVVLTVVAVILFVIAAFLSAGWVVTTTDPTAVQTLALFGLGSFAAAHLPI